MLVDINAAVMAESLAIRWEKVWQGSSQGAPDVWAFLEEAKEASAAEQLEVVQVDLKHRWKTPVPLKVEDYLQRMPDLAKSNDAVLQLAVSEFQARQTAETVVSVQEYTERFSELGDVLRSRLLAISKADESLRTETQDLSSLTWKVYIGRYERTRLLGQGAFGSVWLGYDEQLQRQVAIKVPRADRFHSLAEAESYLAEARTVARLDHSHIVPVYDAGKTEDGLIYVVSKYVEGYTLFDLISKRQLEFDEIAKLLATIAQALHYAHEQRLIHRDIKPENILIEERTKTPYVADFGLAIREEDYLKDRRLAGTPAYMSPEQVRGEGHRLDGRSDIFAVGVMLYQMLTGRRPFNAAGHNALFEQILTLDPPAPSELRSDVPQELQRICIKCLAKQASDRYASAGLLADDLLNWKQGPEKSFRERTIVPKGLRSFDANDSEFFIDLLPGPRDREGLPESLVFWKRRIESKDPEQSFGVGLLYGPSGCGKSSFVKAGLIPRLSGSVIKVYLEATGEDTEARLLNGLRKTASGLPTDLGLVDSIAWLRVHSTANKLVILIDQFEQWLHNQAVDKNAELVRALRQCDGVHVQTVLMIRDDFALAAARFMKAIDTPIVERQNFAVVDLFDTEHAEKVFTKYGQAFNRLPPSTLGMTDEQRAFVKQVVAGLSSNGTVVSVQLALFAEMVKTKPWESATLATVGGTQGIGVNFLEETFRGRQANPIHRTHEAAVQRVLRALLPDVTTDIKGHQRSREELLDASGYAERPEDFDELMQVLDQDLKLITPTEGAQGSSVRSTRYYQLAHDYLVPSLREWLTRKQKETRAGLAELKLEERTAQWQAKPENRYLPNLIEWVSIRSLTDRKHWTEPQRSLMRRAGRVHARNVATSIAVCAALLLGGWIYRSQERTAQLKQVAEERVAALLNAETKSVPELVQGLEPYRKDADPLLQRVLMNTDATRREKLHAQIALLPVDATLKEPLQRELLMSEPADVLVLRDVLSPHAEAITDSYWKVLLDPSASSSERLAAATALAMYQPKDERWQRESASLVTLLTNENPLLVPTWIEGIRSVKDALYEPLAKIFRNDDGKASQYERDIATSILESYAADNVDQLSDLVLASEPKQLAALFDELSAHRDAAIKRMESELAKKLSPTWPKVAGSENWKEVPKNLQEKIESAQGFVHEAFAVCQSLPLSKFEAVANELETYGYRPSRIRPYNAKPVKPNPSAADVSPVMIAAIWKRDGRAWEWTEGLTKDEMLEHDTAARRDGYCAIDVAGYLQVKDGSPVEAYAALWIKQGSPEEESRMHLGSTTYAELKADYGKLEKDGFPYQSMLHQFRGLDGNARCSGIKTKHTGRGSWHWDHGPTQYADREYLDKVQCDVSIATASVIESNALRNERRLSTAEKILVEKPQDLQALYDKASALLSLDRNEESLEPLNIVAEKASKFRDGIQSRAICLARLGKDEEAAKDLETLRGLTESRSTIAYVTAILAGHNEDFETADKTVLELIEKEPPSNGDLYDAVCTYAILSNIAKAKDADRGDKYRKLAIETLQRAIKAGYQNYGHMEKDSDLDPIRELEEFKSILAEGRQDRRYTCVWNEITTLDSTGLHGQSPLEHLQAMRELAENGYRPCSISVLGVGSNEGATTASVWQRPRVPPREQDALAQRQANAAVALLKVGITEPIWPLFEDSPDPSLRSWIIHRVVPANVAIDAFSKQFAMEKDVSSRRSLLIAMGGYLPEVDPSAKTSTLDRIGEVTAKQLLDTYQDDPDPGMHGTAEWVLRRMGQSEGMEGIDRELSTGCIEGDRKWYLTKQGQTLTVLDPVDSFVMGSSADEPDRNNYEQRHRHGIPRRVALGTKEVTLAEFATFKRANPTIGHNFTAKYFPYTNCPQGSVTWYEAAAYCRWLSEQEGITEDQMCYPEVSKIGAGMDLPKDYYQRTGYRLPSESEWEYGARGGISASRYWGQTNELIVGYGWFMGNSGDKTWPVGLARPNAFGFFDALGNVYEWCTDEYLNYSTGSRTPALDFARSSQISDSKNRVLRGCSFDLSVTNLRCAFRNLNRPTYRFVDIAIRFARTYP